MVVSLDRGFLATAVGTLDQSVLSEANRADGQIKDCSQYLRY